MDSKTQAQVVVSRELRDALKIKAIQSGRRLQDIVEEVLKSWLTKQK